MKKVKMGTLHRADGNVANKSDVKLKNLTLTGLFAAIITVMTAYICHIPVGGSGAYIHLGDAMIFLAACLLPRPYAIAAACIGGGLADLLTAPVWAPATIVIKLLLALLFTNKSDRIITKRNVAAAWLSYLITGPGYFLAEVLLFGSAEAAFVLSMSSNLIQSLGSASLFILFGLALDRGGIKKRL